MTTNYPTTLDDDTSLFQVTDGVSAPLAAHHNNTKDAIKALEAKVGIFNTSAPTSLDYRLGHPTSGHSHNAASGGGARLYASSLRDLNEVVKHIVPMSKNGTMVATTNFFPPLVIGRNLILESVQAAFRKAPSGATAAFDINIGATSIYAASQGFRPIFPAGATAYRSSATPNWMTYPSGVVITVDVDAVGSSEPGQDVGITLVFRNE